MARAQRTYAAPDGTVWRVDVRNPGASNAQVFFVHPDPRRTRENRYAHFLWHGPESRNVSGRIDPAAVLAMLTDSRVTELFRRSMQMSGRPSIEGRSL